MPRRVGPARPHARRVCGGVRRRRVPSPLEVLKDIQHRLDYINDCYEQYDGHFCRLAWSLMAAVTRPNSQCVSVPVVGVSSVSTRPAASRAQIRGQLPAAELRVLGFCDGA